MTDLSANMSRLCNRLNKEQALRQIAQEDFNRRTLSFYRYVRIADPQQMRDHLFIEWSELGVLGRIYLSQEGINAQICVPEPRWDDFVRKLYAHPEFTDMPFKVAVEEEESFWKLTIKVRHQIVADGLPEDEYDVTNVGTHLDPEAFNDALEDDNTVVVDMRNHYESRIGRFENALCPDADTFREELPLVKEALRGKEDKKVLLYCTGGIRCEKASAYLKHHGFRDVNQLHGGIIQYAHEVKKQGLRSRFIGKNFVFDERIAETITTDVLTECDQCGNPCDDYTNCRNTICNLLFIQCQDCFSRHFNCCSDACEEIARLPIEEQRKQRAGIPHTFTRYKRQIRPELRHQ
ncbi:MAG: rhodanese-related sulfurtransferase [bacterium]|nr:rhodanese-related sulfurtransferase [bacterium]